MLKIQRILLGLFILLIPIIYPLHHIKDMRDFQQALFQYGVMIVSVFFVRNIWLALFFCWTLFLYYLNGCSVGHDTVFNVYFGVILFGISRQLYSKFKFEKEARWILAVGLISILFMVLQYFKLDPLHAGVTNEGTILRWDIFNDPVGIFALKAHNGIYLALLVPILAMFHPLLGLAMLLPIKLCDSSGAMLAAGLSLLFFLWFLKRRWFFIVGAIALLGMGLFFIHDYKSGPKMYGSRFNIWHLTVRQSLLRPIGYGPDSFRNITPHKDFMIMGDQDFHSAIGYTIGKEDTYNFIYYDPNQSKMKEINDKKTGYQLKSPNAWDHPHNEYLNLLFCWGVPGLVLFGFFMKDCLFRFSLAEKTVELVLVASMILVYLVSSMVQFPLSVARLGYLLPLILGAFFAVTENQHAVT